MSTVDELIGIVLKCGHDKVCKIRILEELMRELNVKGFTFRMFGTIIGNITEKIEKTEAGFRIVYVVEKFYPTLYDAFANRFFTAELELMLSLLIKHKYGKNVRVPWEDYLDIVDAKVETEEKQG